MTSLRAVEVARQVLKAQGVRWDVPIDPRAVEAIIAYGDRRVREAQGGP